MNIDKLEKLAKEYDDNARAIRRTIELMTRHDGQVAVKSIGDKLVAATKLRGHRKKSKRHVVVDTLHQMWKESPDGVVTNAVVARVRADRHVKVSGAHVLSVLNTIHARPSGRGNRNTWLPPVDFVTVPDQMGVRVPQWDELSVAIANANGHATGNGHANGNGNGHRASQTKDARADRHQRMINYMKQFDRKKSRTTESVRARLVADGMDPATALTMIRGTSMMLRTGYLRRKGDGYVTTAKVYQPKV